MTEAHLLAIILMVYNLVLQPFGFVTDLLL